MAEGGRPNAWDNWGGGGGRQQGQRRANDRGSGSNELRGNWRPSHDPRHRELPAFATRIGDPGDPTVLVRDNRDGRLISPFQHEHLFTVEINAEAGINRITEPNQVLQPHAGVYLSVYYVVTTNTHKLNLSRASTFLKAFPVVTGTLSPTGSWLILRSSLSTGRR